MINAGLGCRRGCPPDDLVAAVRAALAASARALDELGALYAPEWKRDEHALQLAAAELGKSLVFVAMPALAAQRAGTLTQSLIVEARFGLPGVAEAAALAGAALAADTAPAQSAARVASALAGASEAQGPRAPTARRVCLLGARVVVGGATCALAELERSA